MKLSTLANILLTEKDISVSEINLLIEYVKGIYRNLGDEIIEEYYYVRSNGKRSGFDKLTGVEFYRDRSIHETVELEDIDVDDYESILYSLVEDMKICSSLFFVMDDSKDKDVSLQKIKVFFEDDTSIPDNYKDRIRTNKYRYIIDDITKMVSVKKSYTELNIDMNYLNLVKELVFEEFKKEYFLIKQNTDKSSEMFARDVVIVFNLDSESLLDEMKSYLMK